MKLLSLQRRMARAVMTPLTPAERMRHISPRGRSMRAEASSFITRRKASAGMVQRMSKWNCTAPWPLPSTCGA